MAASAASRIRTRVNPRMLPPLTVDAVASFDAFRDELLGRDIRDLSGEVDLIVGDDLAGVGDFEQHPHEVQRFNECDGIAVDLAVLDGGRAELGRRGPGELGALDLKGVGVLLNADLRVEGSGPFA